MKYVFINTGAKTRLSTLVMSGDITDENIVQIYDTAGKLITKGNWYQDNILGWAGFWGIASKDGNGKMVKFQLA